VTRGAPEPTFLGVDIGGTFTDVVLADASGRLEIAKELTRRDAPEEGVLAGVRRVLARFGADPGSVQRVVHATTLATNLVIERRGARVAFVATRGFGDLLRIGREARVEDDRYDLLFTPPEPLVPRALTFEVDERMDARGVPIRPLAEAEAEAVAAAIAGTAPEAVAICFLHAYANPEHEQRMEAACRAALPHAHVATSSATWPELREYERATTTLVSAAVAPVLARYLARLEQGLRELGIGAPLQIMESSGGVMSAAAATRRAVATIESGGAAGVMAARRLAAAWGESDVISFDMGGTTAKVGVIRRGEPEITREFHVGGKGSFGGRRAGTGIPIKVPAIDLAEVGAGGGSIAWIDPEGILQVGPRSAGSTPGPACYGQGGSEPTVTDASLVLGYLDPQGFAGGAMTLDRHYAVSAIERAIAAPLGLDAAAAAWGIHSIANANMAAALHVVTVQRGLDPRDYTLVAFGGAGPMHMVGVVERFGIRSLVAAPHAGVASAIGLLGTDLTSERGVGFVADPERLDAGELERRFAELSAAALAEMGLHAGNGAGSERRIDRLVDLRYRGQSHQLTLPLVSIGAGGLTEAIEAFYARTHELYGIDLRGPTEIAALRVRVTQGVPKPPSRRDERSGSRDAERIGARPAWFGSAHGGGYVETAVYRRSALRPGDTALGPAVIEGSVETIVVPPAWRAAADEWGSVVLTRDPDPIEPGELNLTAPARRTRASQESP
jgi:N-methylhydantoinase A